MAYNTTNTEHGGGKTSSAKSGYWGYRRDAKKDSCKARRASDRKAVKES